LEIFMSRYVWELPDDAQCDFHGSGHQIFHVQFNVSMRNPGPIIAVTASVDDDGLVHLEGDDLSLVMWNHRPDALRAALDGFGGRADWKPRWHILAVPMESRIGSARSVFSLATPEQRTECRARVVAADPPPWGEPPEAWERYREHAEAEQEARNAELRRIDYSHIPPLRLAARYADGRRKQRRPGEGEDDGPNRNAAAGRHRAYFAIRDGKSYDLKAITALHTAICRLRPAAGRQVQRRAGGRNPL